MCNKGSLSHKPPVHCQRKGSELAVRAQCVCVCFPSLDLEPWFCLAGEMAHWVKVLAVEPEDLSSISEPI